MAEAVITLDSDSESESDGSVRYSSGLPSNLKLPGQECYYKVTRLILELLDSEEHWNSRHWQICIPSN